MTEWTRTRISTVALQVTLMVLAFALMRSSILRWEELDRQGREEFRTLDLLFGWHGWFVLLMMCLGAALFTLAVRLPVRAGFRWGRASSALLPFGLLWHLRLYFDWAERGFHRSYPSLTELLGSIASRSSTTRALGGCSRRSPGSGSAARPARPLSSPHRPATLRTRPARAEDPPLTVPAEDHPVVPS